MIVFGHNSFLLNACKPSQLGLPPELDKQFTIERRQRYFHLFWIPFFGIGKIWALRKPGDSNLYKPTTELENVLNALPFQEKTPWYTFALFFIILAGGIIFSISEKVNSYQRGKSQERYMADKNEGLAKAIASPRPFQYYDMLDKASNSPFYLKVVSSDQNSILFLFRNDQNFKYDNFDLRLLEMFSSDTLHRSDTVRVKKADLLKTLYTDNEYNADGFEIIPGKGKAVLSEMHEFPNPVLKTVSSAYQEGKFLAVVQNIGEAGVYEGIDVQSTNVAFLDDIAFPKEVKAREYIVLTGTYTGEEPTLSANVNFKTAKADSVKFDFHIYGSSVSLNPSRQ
ncbi:hypothetical protein SAMN04488109_0832 [Chryseolinea serpens]|jgi:hypothetical protein|uniref:Uncharacterized protein n=1 Tax=Chryseolinea serpens TaxID=947013 RepID=A0A1M5KTQ9_9BACT|nr:hypothetical protein [Chryseolinea serpens]SHG56125.1 hypothetical protein SAMN04488109_0832 [Chryseolinea serpens]